MSKEDDEFRRAQEMALAVAALAPKSPGRPQVMTPAEIRMAVADVICERETLNADLYNRNRRRSKNQTKGAKLRYRVAKENIVKQAEPLPSTHANISSRTAARQRPQDKKAETNFIQYIVSSLIEEVFGFRVNISDDLFLEGQDLLLVFGIAHACFFYLSLLSKSFFFNFCTIVCVFNTTAFYCILHRRRAKEADDHNDTNELSLDTRAAEQVMPIAGPRSKINLNWLENETFSDDNLQALQALQPESTLAERKRFLKARKSVVKAASAQLGTYLEWRDNNRLEEFFPSTFTTDEADWHNAARGAMEISNSSGQHVHQGKLLPRLVSVFEDEQTDLVVCNKGARVVHVLPCQLDSTLASPSTYALAVAMYLDRKLDRNYTEKVTVVIDIRSGTGWSNPSSVAIVPFIKLVVGLLNTYFPERLSRCILFPLPYTAALLFNQAKNYLDPDTAAKIQVCSGAGSTNSPIPTQVFSFIDKEAMSYMEERRKSFFA